MMEFLAANLNLPTIIVAVIVFGGVGWIKIGRASCRERV